MSTADAPAASDRARPSDLVERALDLAADVPDHAGSWVVVTEESTANLRWASSTLTTNGLTSGQSVTVGVTVRTAAGTSLGTVSRRGVSAVDLPDLVEQARATAAGAQAAEDAADLATAASDDDFASPAVTTGPESLEALARGLGAALEESRRQQVELFGYAEQAVSTSWLGTSAGVRRRHVQPTGTVELTGKSHQRTRSAFASQAARRLDEVDVTALAEQVGQRLSWQARRVDQPAGRYDAVLPPAAVADLLVYLYWSSDARSAHEGRSALSRRGGGTRVGDVLTEHPLTIASDPAHPGLECEPFVLATSSSGFSSVFDNGLPVPAVTWLDAGRLTALPTSRFTAGLTGLPFHPAADNLVVSSAQAAGDLDALVAGTDRGLLLTSLYYIREVDPLTLLLTGLTRDGVYLVEGGEVVGAVNNFRFNESPIDLLRRIDAAGATEPAMSREWGEYFPRTAVPPVRVRDFNFSSVSQAS